jgi:AraC-like DNA-binding protein
VRRPTGDEDLVRIAPALQRLASAYMQELRVDDLADACHMSTTHFRRVFGRATGRAPLQYLNHIRIQAASALLASTDRSVLDISLTVGFRTLSSFNRQFKAIRGMSPRSWRKVARQ